MTGEKCEGQKLEGVPTLFFDEFIQCFDGKAIKFFIFFFIFYNFFLFIFSFRYSFPEGSTLYDFCLQSLQRCCRKLVQI
jgi:hypothetical protein